jgi:cellulose synthase/poly-beta-1,6-N-acetylglucosamine synthase-like glycosyltransferase
VVLFFYAIRWYVFTSVSMRARKLVGNCWRHDSNPDSCFVSVLLPLYNESNVVDRLLRACTSFNSPEYEVLVVDDSNDGETMEKLDAWRDHPRVRVIHRSSRKGWKGGALNVALDHLDSRSTHVLVLDADFLPPSDVVSRFVKRFEDEKVAVVQGYQRHDLNAKGNWITKGVRAWFMLSNMIELNGRYRLGLFVPACGSLYMIRTDLLREFRFKEDTHEDFDLSLRLYENGYRVTFDPYIASSAECPETLTSFFKQQLRWAQGHTRIFRQHFWKIWRCRHLKLKEKIDMMFVGTSFLNSILLQAFTLATILLLLFPSHAVSLPIVSIGTYLFLLSIPAAVYASIASPFIEGAKSEIRKTPYAWILNYLLTPVTAFGAIRGLFTDKGKFQRTRKTGKITKNC